MAMLNNQRVILIVILIVTKCHQPFILLDDHLLWEELHSIVSELSQSKAAAVEQPALPALVVTGLAQWKRRWEVVFLGWMIPISYEYVYILYIYICICIAIVT